MSTTAEVTSDERPTVTIHLTDDHAQLTCQMIDEIEHHAAHVRIVKAGNLVFAGHPGDLIDLGLRSPGLGGETSIERAVSAIAAEASGPGGSIR